MNSDNSEMTKISIKESLVIIEVLTNHEWYFVFERIYNNDNNPVPITELDQLCVDILGESVVGPASRHPSLLIAKADINNELSWKKVNLRIKQVGQTRKLPYQGGLQVQRYVPKPKRPSRPKRQSKSKR